MIAGVRYRPHVAIHVTFCQKLAPACLFQVVSFSADERPNELAEHFGRRLFPPGRQVPALPRTVGQVIRFSASRAFLLQQGTLDHQLAIMGQAVLVDQERLFFQPGDALGVQGVPAAMGGE